MGDGRRPLHRGNRQAGHTRARAPCDPRGNASAEVGGKQLKGVDLGYRAGKLNTSFSTGETKYSWGDFTQSNFGINYDFGDLKLMVLLGKNKVGATATTTSMFGAQWAIGLGEIRCAYTTLKANDALKAIVVAGGRPNNDANHLALGYAHALSKSTVMYGTRFFVGNGFAPTKAGGTSTGYELGVRHSF